MVITPPQQTATPELHSASCGLAVPPRPIRTAALRRAGERTGVGAPPRRGGTVEIALSGTARLPPPSFCSSLPAIFYFSNSNYTKLLNCFLTTSVMDRAMDRAMGTRRQARLRQQQAQQHQDQSQQRAAVAARRAQNRQRERFSLGPRRGGQQ